YGSTFYFFFSSRRRHTSFSRDWSSDVCSSDLADAGAQRGDQGGDLLAGDQAVEARLLHVQHLAAQRQNGLELAVAALLGGATGRVPFHNVELGKGRIFFLAVGQLSGQAGTFQHALATGHLACTAGGVASPGGFNDLVAQGLGVVGVF